MFCQEKIGVFCPDLCRLTAEEIKPGAADAGYQGFSAAPNKREHPDHPELTETRTPTGQLNLTVAS